MTRLFFCQNDSLMGESLWQKDSLITLVLFELCLFWYLAQSQILGNSLYVQVFCWSRSPWNLLFLAKSLITSGLENHKFIIFCWGKGQVQSPRCMFTNYYPVIILIYQFKFHLPCLAWSCVVGSLAVSCRVARGQAVRGRVANNTRNFLTSIIILLPDEILLKCTSV